MDIVSLLFYPSWLKAIRDATSPACDASVFGERRFYRAMDGGPDWRRALAPLAVIGLLVLAGALFPAGAGSQMKVATVPDSIVEGP